MRSKSGLYRKINMPTLPAHAPYLEPQRTEAEREAVARDACEQHLADLRLFHPEKERDPRPLKSTPKVIHGPITGFSITGSSSAMAADA